MLLMQRFFLIQLALLVSLASLQADASAEDWTIQKRTKGDGSSSCYAYALPYSSKWYSSEESEAPYFEVAYKGNNTFSLAVFSRFKLGKKSVMLKVGNYTTSLETMDMSANTYSAQQDVDTINEIIFSSNALEVEVFDAKNNNSLHAYDTSAFRLVLQKLNKECAK